MNTQTDEIQTVGGALEELKNQIAWLEYVPEHEFTAAESARLIKACERTTIVIQKLNHKYMD